MVEYPRHYALEIYVGNPNNDRAFCRLETPAMSHPTYDTTTAIEPNSVQVGSFVLRLQYQCWSYECTFTAINAAVYKKSLNEAIIDYDLLGPINLFQIGLLW